MKKVVTPILFLLVSLQFTFAQISQSEKNALVDLYKATHGESWNNTWDLKADVNTWYGVTIIENKVTALNLSMNNLEGKIPSTIGNLTNLKSLNLGFNKIGGNIPNEITQLNNLENLQLFMNQLNGQIPESIGNLSHLKVL
ncbi:MAG: Two component regulator three Y domain protein, partial [Lutibacter sp.]